MPRLFSLERKKDTVGNKTYSFKEFDIWKWFHRWVDAYEKEKKDGKADDFSNWMDLQPMSE